MRTLVISLCLTATVFAGNPTTLRLYSPTGEYLGRQVKSGNSVYLYGPNGTFQGKVDGQIVGQGRFATSYYQMNTVNRRYDASGTFQGTVEERQVTKNSRFAPRFGNQNRIVNQYYGPTGEYQGQDRMWGNTVNRYDQSGRLQSTSQMSTPSRGRFAPAFPQTQQYSRGRFASPFNK